MAQFLTDVPASSARTRELLGWKSEHLGLLDDLEQAHLTQAWLAYPQHRPGAQL